MADWEASNGRDGWLGALAGPEALPPLGFRSACAADVPLPGTATSACTKRFVRRIIQNEVFLLGLNSNCQIGGRRQF